MRSWTVAGKYPIYDDNGKVTHTEIYLVSTSHGHASYTEKVLGDHRTKTEKELVELAQEAYFKSEYADRAMAESVQVIDELSKWREEADKRMAEAEADRNQRFSAMKDKIDQAVANLDIKVDETVAELTELVTGAMTALPSMEEVPNEEPTQ